MNLSQGLDIKIIDGEAYVCGIGSCSDEHLVIPCSYNGTPVVGICEKAFCRNGNIKSVTLPCSVLYVEDQAFSWCRSLEKLQFSAVVRIGDRAFMGCDMLSEVALGDFIQSIGEKAFSYCSSVRSVSLPDSTLLVGASAFEGCRSLSEFSFSNRVKIIESGTFYACENLRRVKVPRDLAYIDDLAFAYCISLNDFCLPMQAIVNGNAFFECGNILNNKVS